MSRKEKKKNHLTTAYSQYSNMALEKGMATHSSILAWRIHGQRSLAGYSPWGRSQTRLSD